MKLNETIKCADGFTMSVQAHGGAYCSPRINNAEKYTAVEVGFPNREEPLLMDFAEDPDKRDYIVSNDKLESLGWSSQYNLDDGIIELIKGYKIIRPNCFGNV